MKRLYYWAGVVSRWVRLGLLGLLYAAVGVVGVCMLFPTVPYMVLAPDPYLRLLVGWFGVLPILLGFLCYAFPMDRLQRAILWGAWFVVLVAIITYGAATSEARIRRNSLRFERDSGARKNTLQTVLTQYDKRAIVSRI